MAEEKTPQGMDANQMCPMGAMCKGMMGKPGSGFLLLIPGLLLVLGGVLILVEPKVLYWLMGGTSILIGIIVFFFANFIRKMSAHPTKAQG